MCIVIPQKSPVASVAEDGVHYNFRRQLSSNLSSPSIRIRMSLHVPVCLCNVNGPFTWYVNGRSGNHFSENK